MPRQFGSGSAPAGAVTRDTRAFTPMRALLLTLASAAAWAPTATGPCVSGHTTATTDDGRVLLFGGLLADGAATDALWEFRPGGGWRELAHAAGVHDGDPVVVDDRVQPA